MSKKLPQFSRDKKTNVTPSRDGLDEIPKVKETMEIRVCLSLVESSGRWMPDCFPNTYPLDRPLCVYWLFRLDMRISVLDLHQPPDPRLCAIEPVHEIVLELILTAVMSA